MSYTKNYDKLYKKLSPIVRRLYRLEVIGEENIPEDGGFIVASNHTAATDVLIISAAAHGRQIRYMAKKELFRTPVAPLIKAFGAFPVDRKNSDVSAVKKSISIIENGEATGIFPQGTRRGGKDPRTTEVRSGVGLLAYRTKAPVIPVLIENKRMKTGIFRKNRIIFGTPIPFDELGFDKGGMAEYDAAAKLIFARICDMMTVDADALPAATEKPSLPPPAETEDQK